MNDIRNGKVYAALFVFFLVVLIVGGYFLTVKLINDEEKSVMSDNIEKTSDTEDYKINKDEDYIYFENVDSKSLEHEIVYQDVVINFNSEVAQNIAEALNSEMNTLKETFEKISEQTLSAEEEEKVLYKEDDIYSATFRKYTRYFYQNYASILVEEFDFDCFNGSVYKNSQSYVFDVSSGKMLTKSELLSMYNKNLDSVKSAVKEKLEKVQTIVNEQELIDITSTLNNLDNEESYALYINKSGFLSISYLVKTTQVDYNDVIILN